MKSLKELRATHTLHPHELTYSIKEFTSSNVDWNVWMPTKGKNLQRLHVWTMFQKRELIMSVLLQRHIQHVALIQTISPESDLVIQVIDGKQRLTAMVEFYNNKFSIELEGAEYFFKDLTTEYQQAIAYHRFRCYVVNQEFGTTITDDEKVAWYDFLSFAGTPQDIEHMKSIKE